MRQTIFGLQHLSSTQERANFLTQQPSTPSHNGNDKIGNLLLQNTDLVQTPLLKEDEVEGSHDDTDKATHSNKSDSITKELDKPLETGPGTISPESAELTNLLKIAESTSQRKPDLLDIFVVDDKVLSSREAEGKLLASLDAKMSLNHRIIAYNIGMAKCIGSKLLQFAKPILLYQKPDLKLVATTNRLVESDVGQTKRVLQSSKATNNVLMHTLVMLHGISPADSAQALKNAAELESKGVDLYRLARYAYHKFSKAQDKVQQDALVVIEAQRQDVIAKDINARLESCIRQAIS